MDNDKLLSSLSEHIAYWYTSVKGEKEIIFPINNVTKEKANQLFMDRYYEADVIIFVVSAREGVTDADEKVAKILCCPVEAIFLPVKFTICEDKPGEPEKEAG